MGGGSAARSIRLRLALLAALTAALALVGQATGERFQRGPLRVAVDAEITPHALPRGRPAPVALTVSGRVATTDRTTPPRLTQLTLELGGEGRLETDGLPNCPRRRLRNADARQALVRCGPSLVGRGSVEAVAVIPHQRPFRMLGRLLAFNGRSDGRPAVWAQVVASNPPLAITLPFEIRRRGGRLRTVLSMTMPRSLGTMPHLTAFRMMLFRRFRFHGVRRSYLSSACPAPPGFTGGYVTAARATYGFAGGRRLSVAAARGCEVRGS